MKLEFLYTYRISENYLGYLINADSDNLEDQEIENIDNFMSQFDGFYIDYAYDYEDIVFTKCEMHGLYDNCAKLNVYKILD